MVVRAEKRRGNRENDDARSTVDLLSEALGIDAQVLLVAREVCMHIKKEVFDEVVNHCEVS